MKPDRELSVRELSKKWFKSKSFREAYDALEPKYAIIKARIKARISQKELARRMRTTQPMIARMESGRQLPSTATLFKVAKATGTRLEIRFVN